MLGPSVGAALLIAGAAAAAFLHLRHLGLWALVLLAPAIAVLPFAFLAQLFARDLLAVLPLAWLFALTLLLLFADEMVLRLLDGEARGPAFRGAFSVRWLAFLSSLLVVAALLVGLGYASAAPVAGGLMALAVAGAALGLGIFAFAIFLPYGESFVARANRMRERAQRVFDILIAVARPRWGFAVAGIGLVFAVLSGFGLKTLTVAPELRVHGALLAGGAACVVVLATAGAIRDWRATLCTLLTLVLSGAVGLWGLTLARHTLDPETGFAFLCVLGAGGVLLLASGTEAGRHGRAGDDATVAAARTLVRMGPGLFFASLAGVAGLALWALHAGPAALALALMAAFAGAGALLFQPAFAIVIERLFPRASIVAARYRLG